MRKHYLLVLCCFLLMGKSCSSVDVTDPDVAAALTEVNEEFRKEYRRMLKDIGTRHYELDRARAFQTIRTAFPDWELIAEDMIGEGDKVVTRWRGHGTHQGRFAEIEPTGQKVEVQYLRPDVVTSHDISLEVKIDAGLPIESITSPSNCQEANNSALRLPAH